MVEINVVAEEAYVMGAAASVSCVCGRAQGFACGWRVSEQFRVLLWVHACVTLRAKIS